MSEQIDFNDPNLIRFQRVKSPADLDGFNSDVDELNEYIGPEMAFDLEHSITRAYLMRIGKVVAAYADLSMAHLKNNATPAIKGKEINSNVPAILISHLTVDVVFQGHGVGSFLLKLIIDRLIPKLKKMAGCRYIMLNPRDDQGVRDFYINYGFEYYEKFEDGRESDNKSDNKQDAFLLDLIGIKEEEEEYT